MPLHQLASNSGGYGSLSNYSLRYTYSSGQNTDPRKKDENDPGCIQYSWFKENVESNPTRKAKTYQCCTNTREIGAKLIALADAFDAEFFGNLNISKKQDRNDSLFSNVH